jgi:uncharacterized protein DUF6600
MKTHAKRLMAMLLALALPLGIPPSARAAEPPGESQTGTIGGTPPRLSYTDGQVSFWRPGAQDWVPAQVNTPLAPGDELYTANRGDVELQVGSRAFVRTWGDTQLGLANQEPDFLRFKITSGHASLDLRSVDPGRTVELDTPHGAFTIEQPGYYRADVTQDQTSFITRRGGRATLTPPGGPAVAISPSEEVVLQGAPTPTVQSYAAPDFDVWDQWNYARSDHLQEAVSARYVPPNVYGGDDLDHYGSWRVVPTYGPVWVPEAIPVGWVPYSTGRWIHDPYYGWTWVDTAPWGWAPYHYGRWVFVGGFWAWAPGPVVVHPVYAPALVAFFGAPGISVSIGGPLVSWVALGWGEPVVPWWGPVGFVGTARWEGWGGPRVVNNVVVNQTTVVNVTNITTYSNVSVQNSVVAVRQEHFGAQPIERARIAQVDVQRLEPVHGPLKVTPEASSFVASSGPTAHPPEAVLARPVVATRVFAGREAVPRGEARGGSAVVRTPEPHIVPAPTASQAESAPPRPAFGASQAERRRPPLPPRFETLRSEAVPGAPGDTRRGPLATAPREPVHGPPPIPAGGQRGTASPTPQPPSPGRLEAPSPRAVPPPPRERIQSAQPMAPAPQPGTAGRIPPLPGIGRPAAPSPGGVPPSPREHVQSPQPMAPAGQRGTAGPVPPPPGLGQPAAPSPGGAPPSPRERVQGRQQPRTVESVFQPPRPGQPPAPSLVGPSVRPGLQGPPPTPPVEQRRAAQSVPQPPSPIRFGAVPTPQRFEPPRSSMRALPGEPANALSPGRAPLGPSRRDSGPATSHRRPVTAPPNGRDQR